VLAGLLHLPGSAQIAGAGAALIGCALIGVPLIGEITASAAGRLRTRDQHAPQSRRKRLIGFVLLLCAAFTVLGARTALLEHARDDPALNAQAESGRVATLTVTLTAYPESRATDFGLRHWARGRIDTASGTVPVLLWLRDPPPVTWVPGTALVVTGRLDRLLPADSAAYTVDAEQVTESELQPSFPMRPVSSMAARLRLALRHSAQQVHGAELVPGFAVGDTSLVSEALDSAMIESSLTHLTAVSGANCALVTGAIMWILARVGTTRRVRLVGAGVALAGFVVLVGPDASVRRAAIMAGVVLISGFGGKRAAALPALGIAILALLTLDPWQALEPGFTLSVLATGGILLLAAPIAHALHARLRLPKFLSLPVALALSAQLSCGPVLHLLQPGIPAIGVIANILAAPAVPLGTGLGLLAALAAPVSAPLALNLVRIASLPARWVAEIAGAAAQVAGGRWHWPEGWPGAVLLIACELLLLGAWALRRGHISVPSLWSRQSARVPSPRPWKPDLPAPVRVRMIIALAVAVSAVIFVCGTVIAPAAERFGTPRDWIVVACDVGQGDAVLVRDPADPTAVMLVDTGDDIGKLSACLTRFGVRRVSLLVLTHDDRDHVGALPAIVSRVDRALIAPTVRGEQTVERPVVQALADAGIPTRIGRARDRSPDGARPAWSVLSPSDPEPEDTNAASLVLMVQAGRTRVLMLADTGASEHAHLLAGGAADELRADVVKVAHHGSRDEDPRLPHDVGATWALISVGADNGYGHPAADTIAAYVRSGSRVLRTDETGSIALRATDSGIEAWVEHPPG